MFLPKQQDLLGVTSITCKLAFLVTSITSHSFLLWNSHLFYFKSLELGCSEEVLFSSLLNNLQVYMYTQRRKT